MCSCHESPDKNYNCGRSHAIGQLACSSHYINRDTFHQAVLEDIRRNAKLFSEDAEKAAQRLMAQKCADQQKQAAAMKRDRFMLHELIGRITIYETPGMGRCRKGKEKRITIYYKFAGAICALH